MGAQEFIADRRKEFCGRSLSPAESEAELGDYHLRSHDISAAQILIEQALKNDPKLAFAHEEMGFLYFAKGKDEDAAREFAQAYELDGSRYLPLFFKTMLSSIAKSDASENQVTFHNALLNAIHLNPDFAPAYVELARLAVRQGNSATRLQPPARQNNWSLHAPGIIC
jgi:tetratricopeptide (TPR) repeat protein